MKLFFILLITPLLSIAQNRKSILDEISSYKENTIENMSYKVSIDSLQKVLKKYMLSDEYIFDSINDTKMVFHKRLNCPGEPEFIGTKKAKYNNYLYLNFYVSISLIKKAGKLQSQITTVLSNNMSKYEYNQAVLSGRNLALKVSDDEQDCFLKYKRFKFKALDIKKYLYVYFNGKKIPFPLALQHKINGYNLSQTKDKKKLIASRDY